MRTFTKIAIRTKRLTQFLTACLVLIVVGAAAVAEDGYEAPEIDDGLSWAAIALSVLSLAAVLFAAFHNPKRSHLEED